MITIKTDLLFCCLLLSARFFWGFPPSACGRTFKRYFFGFSNHDTQLRLDYAFRVLIEHGHFQILHNFVILEILLDLLGLELEGWVLCSTDVTLGLYPIGCIPDRTGVRVTNDSNDVCLDLLGVVGGSRGFSSLIFLFS